ncbi:MAG: PPOX class F420-dependent oxidoreductase [Chloroflexota bacterium]|nr:PPOX class F420-dependent oxidoreductase [Chloroflexota bacterium]
MAGARRREVIYWGTLTRQEEQMATSLPAAVRELLDGKNFAHVATLMRDGSPQVTAVWIDVDGDRILINTAEGRTKPANVRRDPRVAISIVDQENPYRAAFIRGRVVDLVHEGAAEHIDRLSEKYWGRKYAHRPGEQRVILVIEPDHVRGMGLAL